ncbi:MAG: type II toxin-antitoxin system Phd/YefM family antitoxin [Opitutaceae bacterium]
MPDAHPSDPIPQALAGLPTVTASSLKNNFGEASMQASKGALAITRHNRAEFVLMPVGQYVELQRSRQAPLDALAAQFEAMVARMNTPAAKRGIAKLFKATPAELGKSAVKAARVRGR